jgi:glycosyltransferase involved in cell wall biosynthesis
VHYPIQPFQQSILSSKKVLSDFRFLGQQSMKIVFFIYSLNSGGAERVTANLANHWVGKGWDISIITLKDQNNDFYRLDPAINRITLNLAGDSYNILTGLRQNLGRVYSLKRALRQIQPDVALGMMSTANVMLALATWGVPQVRTIGSERTHPSQVPLAYPWHGLRRLSYSRLDAVTAQTSKGADWLKAHTNARRVPVIPNPVLWPLPMQAPRITPEDLCQSERLMMLAVGRASEEKQFGLLLEIFHSLANRHPNWDLVILGEGPQRPALREQVRTAGLEKRVSLPGRAGNMKEWYERADLYVMSSRFEGFPNTLAEAMAHGLASVSFDCDTGPSDIIRHGVDGLLVPPGDVTSLTVALDRMMSDAGLRQQFAVRAVEARRRFSIKRIAGLWEELFEEILE